MRSSCPYTPVISLSILPFTLFFRQIKEARRGRYGPSAISKTPDKKAHIRVAAKCRRYPYTRRKSTVLPRLKSTAEFAILFLPRGKMQGCLSLTGTTFCTDGSSWRYDHRPCGSFCLGALEQNKYYSTVSAISK